MNYLNLNTDEKSYKRPDLLTVLCILTFIGSGIRAFSSFFISISYNEAITFWEETEFNIPEMEIIMSGGKGFFVTGFIFYTVALFGAIQMWKLKKIGFHLYTVAQILLLILP
ncbi:MAG: hypothetical protein K8R58_14395, partial [Bacteroidales bacterium]|nr:hypothetical protein [Bacteroidales bacterium]